MINNVVLVGRLTATPELRITQSGLSVTSFTVAVDRRYTAGGDRQVDFINCVAWRQSAEFITKYFSKGKFIGISGSIQTRNYEDKHGNKRTAVEVVVNNVSFIGTKDDVGQAKSSAGVETAPSPSYQSGSIDDFQEITSDGDLPF